MQVKKKQIRALIKELKNTQDKSTWGELSETIFYQLEQQDEFKSATSILAYWSLPDEVITHMAVERWAKSKKVYLPVVKGDDLELVRFEGVESMKPESTYGILEPTSNEKVEIGSIDLVVVPGVAFDKKCNRMGRGKGYYDRLLSESVAAKVGVAFNFQTIDEVPVESHDIKLDMVISETNIIKR